VGEVSGYARGERIVLVLFAWPPSG